MGGTSTAMANTGHALPLGERLFKATEYSVILEIRGAYYN